MGNGEAGSNAMLSDEDEGISHKVLDLLVLGRAESRCSTCGGAVPNQELFPPSLKTLPRLRLSVLLAGVEFRRLQATEARFRFYAPPITFRSLVALCMGGKERELQSICLEVSINEKTDQVMESRKRPHEAQQKT